MFDPKLGNTALTRLLLRETNLSKTREISKF